MQNISAKCASASASVCMWEYLEKQTKLNKTFEIRKEGSRVSERVEEAEASAGHEKHSASKLGSCLN